MRKSGCIILTSSFAVAIASRAQELSSTSPSPFDNPAAVQALDVNTIPSSVEPAPQSAPANSLLRWGPIHVRPHLDFRFSYGDGILPRPGDPRTTAYEALSPGVLFDLGTHWFLDYTPTLNYYSNKEFKDNLGHRVLLHGVTTYEDWTFGLSQGYTSTSTPLIETGAQTDQEIFFTALNASYHFNSKWLLELGVNQIFRSAQEFTSSRDWSTLDWLNYQIAPKVAVGIGAGFGYDNLSSGSDMSYEQLLGRVVWQVADKVNLSIDGGGDLRQFVSSDRPQLFNPIYQASIQYRPFEFTTLSLYGGRTVTASYFSDQVTESTDIGLALRQRLFGLLYLDLGGGYRKINYVSSSSTSTDRTDDIKTFTARLGCQFLTRGTIAAFYQFNDDDSTVPGFSYSSSQVGFQISYRF